MASAAVRARATVSSLVSSSKLIICRKSCTGLLLPAGTAGVVCAVIAGLVRAVDEGGVVDLGLQAGAMGLVEDVQVADPGGLGLLALLLVAGAGLGVPVAADDERDSLARGPALVPYVDACQAGRVEDQLDDAPDQGRVDLVEVPVQGHGGGLADGAPAAHRASGAWPVSECTVRW